VLLGAVSGGDMRAAVIGAGIVGSCVGWNLARRGADVLLVDTGPPGAGVTNWTFAWLNASNKTRTREYFDLSVAGVAAHRDLAATLGSAAWLHSTGHLRWAGEPAGAQALRAALDLLAAWGYDAALWRAERVRQILEPGICFPGDDTEVAFYRDEGWADGRELPFAWCATR
jgi:glycine/D-amino acid oxidase-like deaminating enzyme